MRSGTGQRSFRFAHSASCGEPGDARTHKLREHHLAPGHREDQRLCCTGDLLAVAQKVSTDPVLGAPSRIKGLRLTATDVDWSVGDGEEVTGAAEALILAMSGREVVLPELVGPGVARLAARR